MEKQTPERTQERTPERTPERTHDMIRQQIQIARDALSELSKADQTASERLRNQVALALDSIAALIEHKPS